jgi:hypothetical protein
VGTETNQHARRPRKRPPLRSYIPFAIFLCICGLLLSAVVWLLVTLTHVIVPAASPRHPAPTATAVSHMVAQQRATAPTQPRPGTPTVRTAPAAPPATAGPTGEPPTSTAVRSASLAAPTATPTILVALTPGGPLPTRTPSPTATATGRTALVIARDVDPSGRPLEQAARFISPALRLYAIATVRHLRSADVLRFVFQRDGMILPHDDISYTAGTDADVQALSAYADYKGGSTPLPHGHYLVLFYRNGTLEAATTFQIG